MAGQTVNILNFRESNIADGCHLNVEQKVRIYKHWLIQPMMNCLQFFTWLVL